MTNTGRVSRKAEKAVGSSDTLMYFYLSLTGQTVKKQKKPRLAMGNKHTQIKYAQGHMHTKQSLFCFPTFMGQL